MRLIFTKERSAHSKGVTRISNTTPFISPIANHNAETRDIQKYLFFASVHRTSVVIITRQLNKKGSGLVTICTRPSIGECLCKLSVIKFRVKPINTHMSTGLESRNVQDFFITDHVLLKMLLILPEKLIIILFPLRDLLRTYMVYIIIILKNIKHLFIVKSCTSKGECSFLTL